MSRTAAPKAHSPAARSAEGSPLKPLALHPRSWPGQLLAVAALAIVYFMVARLLISLSHTTAGPVTTVWLPSGIAVGSLILGGPRLAVGAFLGSLAVALETGASPGLALTVALGNAGGELLCYALLTGWGRRVFSVEEVIDGPRLAGAAAVAGALSATVSVTAYVLFGLVPADAYLANWLSWTGSGISSMVVVAPLLVYAVRSVRGHLPPPGRLLEYVAALLLLVLAAFLWQGPHFQRGVDEPAILALILGQLWIAFRFSPAAMALPNFAIAATSVWALVLRLGEAPPASAYAFILSSQLMLTGLALIGYFLASMVRRQGRTMQALRDAQGAFVAAARDAGRAEIATNVLHNVGNVLNSVNVSAQLVVSRLEASRARGIGRVAQMLESHRADLGAFLAHDDKGRLLPAYLGELAKAVEAEQREQTQELQSLVRHIDHIKDVVGTQQSYAGVSTVLEQTRLHELVEDALRLDQHALSRTRVTVVREFGEVPAVPLDKARIVQILLNLISNARHAMEEGDGSRRMTLRVGRDVDGLHVSVGDEGEGIEKGNLTRIFAHGFTTRPSGHGFGLHGSALAAAALGGTLTAHSDGPGRGATFTLRLPLGTASPT
jgi:signal transduction histidine kinase